MTALALPWLVLESTGSPAQAGLVAAAEWVPMALLGIPCAPIAARLGPRRTMLVCDLARAPLVALIAVLYATDSLPFGVLIALAFMLGGFFPAHFASQRTILPDLLGERPGAVTKGNALLQAANRLPLVLGPAVGGVLLSVLGPTDVLLLDSGSYLVSAALLAFLVPDRPRLEPDTPEAAGLLAGVRALMAEPLLRTLTLVYGGIELAMQALILSLPILAFTVYDGHAWVAGVLLASWALGALAGTFIAYTLARRDGVVLVRIALLIQAVPLWVLALDVPPEALAVALFVSGLANPVANAPANTLVTMRVPEALRAKSMLAFVTVSLAAGGVGLIVTGPAAQAFGARTVLLVAAGVSTACAVGFALATREGVPLRRTRPST